MELTVIFGVCILIMSVVIHELAHGYTAVFFGDPTPRLQGRLTLNPLKHLEWFGSVIVPITTGMLGVAFGWAKPVQFNPYNLSNRRWGEFWIALAGPASNLLIAAIFGIIIRILLVSGHLPVHFIQISAYVVTVNVFLAIFNLMPLPPLDGSKILFNIIPQRYNWVRDWMERYSIAFGLIAIFLIWRFVEPVIPYIFSFFTGVSI